MLSKFIRLGMIHALALSTYGYASPTLTSLEKQVRQVAQQQLQQQFFGTAIQIHHIAWDTPPEILDAPSTTWQVQLALYTPDHEGQVRFKAYANNRFYTGHVLFMAKSICLMPLKPLKPGTLLEAKDFQALLIQEEKKPHFFSRGLYVKKIEKDKLFETLQTLPTSQCLLSHQIQKTPDLAKGKSVEVSIYQGNITLTTSGILKTTGYVNSPVNVFLPKQRKEFSGILTPHKKVEVRF